MRDRQTWCAKWSLAGVVLVWLAACADRGAIDDPEILATVGDDVITVAEFEREMQARGRQRPGYYAESERREQLLEEMIHWRALVNEARAQGIDREPEIRRMIERLLVQRLRDERVNAELEGVAVTDDEIAAFYQAHRDQFSRPARIQGAIIHIEVPAGADDAARAPARERVQAALDATAELPADMLHFGPVAAEYSDDRASRYQGGVIGWLVDRPERGYRWDEAVTDALFALETPGDTGPVIETDNGYYLVRLAAHEAVRSRPLEQVADGIKHRLIRERRAELEAGLSDRLMANHKVDINHARLGAITAPEAADPAPEQRDSARTVPPALPGGTSEPPAENAVLMEEGNE